jgi:hypothetical protein
MGFNTSLGLLGSYDLTTPSPVVSNNNYIDFTSTATQGWAQQYLPEVYEQEVERYGNRRLSGFLKMVGAEMPMESDQVVWSEQNRLHIAVKSAGAVGTNTTSVQLEGTSGTISLGTSNSNSFRVGNTVIVTDADTGLKTLKCYVSVTSGAATADGTSDITVLPYTQTDLSGGDGSAVVFSDNEQVNIFVYGSEFAKGSASMGDGTNSGDGLKADFQQYTNKPIIIKDHFKISGSDTAQIGWVETTGEDGATGYSWYLKSSGETRMRFEDYLETAMVEAVEVTVGASTVDSTIADANDATGTQGLLDAIENRGNIFEDLVTLADFDLVLKNLDKQGAIEENMLYVNRSLSLTIDDMVAGLNSNYNGGASFGVFNNEADMALNLGFSGFRRGSYDFYKSDWKYLNDAAGRGGFGDVSGVLIPAGVSSVYDESLGKNMKRPFLHVRYRKSATDDRRLKSWVTGSVGSASYSGTDVMEVHYLSERCLITQGANNFVMLKES